MREKYEGVVDIKNMKQDTLESILDFIYTGCARITDNNVFDLLENSDYAQVASKCEQVWHSVLKPRIFR